MDLQMCIQEQETIEARLQNEEGFYQQEISNNYKINYGTLISNSNIMPIMNNNDFFRTNLKPNVITIKTSEKSNWTNQKRMAHMNPEEKEAIIELIHEYADIFPSEKTKYLTPIL